MTGTCFKSCHLDQKTPKLREAPAFFFFILRKICISSSKAEMALELLFFYKNFVLGAQEAPRLCSKNVELTKLEKNTYTGEKRPL